MKHALLFAFLIFSSLPIFSQNNEIINEIIFKTGSRGGEKTIIIHPDSAFFETIRRSAPGGTTKSKIKIKKSDWHKLITSISKYKFIDLVNLASPTHLRESDRANFSTISIVTNKSKYDCGAFDDFNPNEKLSKLMKAIQKIEKMINNHLNSHP